jgi:hypothetical protein
MVQSNLESTVSQLEILEEIAALTISIQEKPRF